MPKIIISGGGTGGHVYPAIAIANALKAIDPTIDILFVGAQGRLEMEKVPKAGYPIEGLWIDGFQRSLSLRNLSFPFKLVASLGKSWSILQKFKPDVAVGVGGYASGPLLQMASLKGIPTLIQEQNSYPGITNRLLAKRVQKICVAYDNLGKFFPKENIILTGNPIRKDIWDTKVTQEEAKAYFGLNPNKKVVFSMGGSLGAKGINEGIAPCLDKFQENDIQLIWQAGKYYIDWAKELVGKDNKNIDVRAFVDRMDLAYLAADVIVARAGAISISELCVVGKPVILQPSPNVSEDHQTANAMALVNKDAAIMLKDEVAKTALFDHVLELLTNETKSKQMSANIKKLAITDSADRIAREVLKMV